MAYGLIALMTATHISACYMEEQLHWSLPIWLPYVVRGVRRKLCWLRHQDRGTNPVTSIPFSCAAIHFPAVYNLERYQRPVPPIPCLYDVGC